MDPLHRLVTENEADLRARQQLGLPLDDDNRLAELNSIFKYHGVRFLGPVMAAARQMFGSWEGEKALAEVLKQNGVQPDEIVRLIKSVSD